MRKKQNTRRDIAESVHRIYAAGLYVTAGFIIGSSCRKSSGSSDGKLTALLSENFIRHGFAS